MALVRFPPGDPVFEGRQFRENLFVKVDALLKQGQCPDGWFELETPDARLICLIHESRPYLAGLVEPGFFSWVPLRDFPIRARQLDDSVCNLVRADTVRVLLLAVHFRNRPVLQAATNLIDLNHVLDVLAAEKQEACVALERAGTRTLLFLQDGVPTCIYFCEGEQDPGEGSVADRFLLLGFAPDAPIGKVEVFDQLAIESDPDAGRELAKLAKEAKAPPPMTIQVKLAGRLALVRPFMPPVMTIGRAYTCELILDNLSVSRQHARLSWERGQFVIEDLDSANGITLNDETVTRATMAPGDRIGLGKFQLFLAKPPEAIHPETTMQIGPANKVLCLVGGDKSVPITDEVTIGRGRGVDVRAQGMSVQTYHARLKAEGQGSCRLICLGRAKVRLNGKKVREAQVREGDELEVGSSRFRFIAIPTGS